MSYWDFSFQKKLQKAAKLAKMGLLGAIPLKIGTIVCWWLGKAKKMPIFFCCSRYFLLQRRRM